MGDFCSRNRVRAFNGQKCISYLRILESVFFVLLLFTETGSERK